MSKYYQEVQDKVVKSYVITLLAQISGISKLIVLKFEIDNIGKTE